MFIEAIVFDMDGVLVDSEPALYASTNEVLQAHGAFLEQEDYDRCRGMGVEAFFELLIKRFDLDADPKRLAQERLRVSLVRIASQTLLPMQGALDCLLALSSEGYALALASAGRRLHVDLVVDKLGIRRLLKAIVSLDDVTNGKPEPDLFLEAAARLKCEPSRCLVIEDAVHGVQAGRAAGMSVIALPPAGDDGARHRAAGASVCLESLAELTPDFIEAFEPA